MSEYLILNDYDTALSRVKEQLTLFPEGIFDDYYEKVLSRISPATAYNYARAFVFFLRWLIQYHREFEGMHTTQITISELEKVKKQDVEIFLEHVKIYGSKLKDEIEFKQKNRKGFKGTKTGTRNTYLVAINTAYNFLVDQELLLVSPAYRIRANLQYDGHRNVLNRLYLKLFFECIETGEGLNVVQKEYHERTKERDLTICRMLCGTKVKPSDLVCLDVEDLDLHKRVVHIHRMFENGARKTDEVILDLDEDSVKALRDYLAVREKLHPASCERSLFLSGRGNNISSIGERLSERSIQRMVQKYARCSLPVDVAKYVTPNSLKEFSPGWEE